jgi:thioredoxin 1
MKASNIKELDDKNFINDVILSRTPTVVVFFTEWSGSCHIIEPVIEELSSIYEGRVNFASMNLESNDEIPKNYNIIFLPTLLYIKNGIVKHKDLGVVSRDEIVSKLDSLIDED